MTTPSITQAPLSEQLEKVRDRLASFSTRVLDRCERWKEKPLTEIECAEIYDHTVVTLEKLELAVQQVSDIERELELANMHREPGTTRGEQLAALNQNMESMQQTNAVLLKRLAGKPDVEGLIATVESLMVEAVGHEDEYYNTGVSYALDAIRQHFAPDPPESMEVSQQAQEVDEEAVRLCLRAAMARVQECHAYHVADVALDAIRPFFRVYQPHPEAKDGGKGEPTRSPDSDATTLSAVTPSTRMGNWDGRPCPQRMSVEEEERFRRWARRSLGKRIDGADPIRYGDHL